MPGRRPALGLHLLGAEEVKASGGSADAGTAYRTIQEDGTSLPQREVLSFGGGLLAYDVEADGGVPAHTVVENNAPPSQAYDTVLHYEAGFSGPVAVPQRRLIMFKPGQFLASDTDLGLWSGDDGEMCTLIEAVPIDPLAWKSALDLNFAFMGTQTLTPNTDVVLGGKTFHTEAGAGLSSLFEVTAGQGLRIAPAYDTWHDQQWSGAGGPEPPGIYVTMANLHADLAERPPRRAVRAWFLIATNTDHVGNKQLHVGFKTTARTYNQRWMWGVNLGADQWQDPSFTNVISYAARDFPTEANVTVAYPNASKPDVLVVEWRAMNEVHILTGQSVGGAFPAEADLDRVAVLGLGITTLAGATASVSRFRNNRELAVYFLAAYPNGTDQAGTFIATLKRLLVEYR